MAQNYVSVVFDRKKTQRKMEKGKSNYIFD